MLSLGCLTGASRNDLKVTEFAAQRASGQAPPLLTLGLLSLRDFLRTSCLMRF